MEHHPALPCLQEIQLGSYALSRCREVTLESGVFVAVVTRSSIAKAYSVGLLESMWGWGSSRMCKGEASFGFPESASYERWMRG